MVKKNTPIIKEKRNAIIYIIYELLKGKRLSTKDISHLIQRDIRTCQRYIKELEESDLPLNKEGIKYYLNTDDGYLPIYLTKEKINILYIALLSFSAFGEDVALINDLLNQIKELVPPSNEKLLNSIKNNLMIKRRYEIIQSSKASNYSIFMLLLEGFSNRRSIKIKYKSKDDLRVIDIYGFCLAKETYYINAYCYKRKTILMFRIDRILECSLENQQYTIPKEFNLKDFYKYTWEVENSRQVFEFEVKLYNRAIKNVIGRKWCENQSIEKDECGSVIFKGKTSSEVEFKKWILSLGSNARIVKPKWLQEDIKIELQKSLNNYK
ncbi:WYL domain-containing protein (plasmid) [Clostridium botulinum]|uniref:Uncharacterized protein n=1 Tax=Clostridium botulinum C/D str. DC5 TaxID=1443128 RepID=A0A0A0HWW8_CLOBO|nr:WYL domain-containing protein [Clostridium botulinum]KGM92895.1 hypothetical protein Z956_13210 [Clostridium botulinum D str. CCUG 7971]KGM93047.1 hypothetical protein Z955_16090 [Clostridium botulinum C/D str. DC5]KOC47191.1 hypothetical protein ADU88_10830 [Clostridium botulinum]KOC51515.1 hypothetical protein ADU89_13370 [Clostridium botulinum]KOC56019.1 hypothetical protein ADU90_09170 [Clostridium botulinum]